MTDETKRTPTSMNLDEDLWYNVKLVALKRKITATELVEEQLRKIVEMEMDKKER